MEAKKVIEGTATMEAGPEGKESIVLALRCRDETVMHCLCEQAGWNSWKGWGVEGAYPKLSAME